jgi:hypothetical protein
MFNKSILRDKTGDSYPQLLWIICVLLGIIGAYYSRIGSVYHMVTDSMLFGSAWLILIGFFVLFMSHNDNFDLQQNAKVGIYSAINHPKLFGQFILIIGLALQSINIITIITTIITIVYYNKWLITKSWKSIFIYESYFRFNIFKMTDNKRGLYFISSLNATIPYLIFSSVYLLIVIELRNRTIGRSLIELF